MSFFRKVSVLVILVSLLSSSKALAGGLPQSFDQLETFAEEFIQVRIADYEENYEVPDWAWNECHFWTSITEYFLIYFQFESDFRAEATRNEANFTSLIRLAKATGKGLYKIPGYELKRSVATQQIAKMKVWHSQFETYYQGSVQSNKYYHCSAPQFCSPENQTNQTTVYVKGTNVTPQIVTGVHRHMFGFMLNLLYKDITTYENGWLDEVMVSIIASSDEIYPQLTNCTLETQGEVIGESVPIYNADGGSATLEFQMSDPAVIPMGTGANFDIFCTILGPIDDNSAILVGFIPDYDTSPADAIHVIGMNTASVLEVIPNTSITKTLIK